jgi:hypothetical protein
MSKNPIINALCASGYIVLVVSVIRFLSQTQKDKPDTFLAPILALSLLTLSVTVMGYVFFYQPMQLFLSGKKKEGVNLFMQTVATFAGITLLFLIGVFAGVMR